jgi:hypothetical protein
MLNPSLKSSRRRPRNNNILPRSEAAPLILRMTSRRHFQIFEIWISVLRLRHCWPHKITREPVLRIPTPFLATTLGLALAGLTVARQHAAFTMLSKHPSLSTAARWLFENYAHTVLSDPNLAPLATYIRNEIEAPPNNFISGSTTLKNIRPLFGFYWRLRETNFEGRDYHL